MRRQTKFLSVTCVLILAAIPVYSNLIEKQEFIPISTMQDRTLNSKVTAMAIGPGVTNLSLGDEYATYQWALQNDGEFQLTEMSKNFQFLDTTGKNQSDSTSGPGTYDSKVTAAISGIDINIRPAWELYESAENKRQVIVAIIDTGIEINHPEFQNAMWTNSGETPGDGIDNDGNGFIDDYYGWNFYSNNNNLYSGEEDSHGTHAAGTIAASRKSSGIAGITDNEYVKIMSLKALGGNSGVGSTDTVIKAIQYAEAKGASICNLSLGTTNYDEKLAAAIQNSSMLFVVAAGNGNMYGIGYDADIKPVYPAALPFDNVISVANQLFDGSLSRSSNFGAVSVDIAAPGSYILSTVPENSYGFMSGTSMAAPMVTGVAAMLYSYRTDISLIDVKNILLSSSRKLDVLNGKVSSGGMLDAFAALSS